MAETTFTRRHFIAVSMAALGGLALFGCSGASESNSSGEGPAGTAAEPSAAAPSSEGKGTRVLVACFSATGNTRAVAQAAAAHLDADYFEIEAAVPYTAEDLDYGDETTRATAEQNDLSARPAIAAAPDFSAYDVVLLGHPIWWGMAPRLMCTLLEGADLAGKKVAEFCTSGSSGVEQAAAELEGLASGADWVGAQRFAAGASESEVADWIDSLNVR